MGSGQVSQSQKRCEDFALSSSCWSNNGNGLADTSKEPEKALDPPGFVKLGKSVPTLTDRSTLCDIQISALIPMGLARR